MSDSTLGTQSRGDVAAVMALVVETLGIQDRAETMDASTPLTSLAELDSLAVVEILVELERRFGITVEDEDVTAEVIETVASLAAFAEAKSHQR